MSEIILFHSALGLNDGVSTFAEVLRAEGHTVHTPDLFDGLTFTRLADGVAKRDELGIPELGRRAWKAVESLPTDVFYAGFSMGAASAQMLALMRPGARGALLMHGAIPVQAFGATAWPDGVPVQLHYAKGDPWVPAEAVGAFSAGVAPSLLEAFEYDGGGHLFADQSTSDYDPQAAALLTQRAKAFLGG